MRELRIIFGAFMTGVAAGTVLGMLTSKSPSEAQQKKLEKEFEEMTDKFKEEVGKKYDDTLAQLEEVKRSTYKHVDEKLKESAKQKNK